MIMCLDVAYHCNTCIAFLCMYIILSFKLMRLKYFNVSSFIYYNYTALKKIDNLITLSMVNFQ
jgi:hypothetical protein